MTNISMEYGCVWNSNLTVQIPRSMDLKHQFKRTEHVLIAVSIIKLANTQKGQMMYKGSEDEG